MGNSQWNSLHWFSGKSPLDEDNTSVLGPQSSALSPPLALTPESFFTGILLGTAVGDSLGLPAEGLGRRRIARLFPGPWRQRFYFGSGMVSDDTEHTVFIAESLLEEPSSPQQFQTRFARRLKWWLAALPAGVGWATLRAILKLWLGVSPQHSGVYSAGNGAAMRAAILGGCFAGQTERLLQFVQAATKVTHTDTRAQTGALAIARLVELTILTQPVTCPAETIFHLLSGLADSEDDAEWHKILGKLRLSYEQEATVAHFADTLKLNRGVTGYVYHTVPVAMYAWMHHYRDFRATLEAVLNCGGDTDTVAAIAGALAGATVGPEGIPPEWLSRLRDWPLSVTFLQRLGKALACQKRGEPLPFPVRPAWKTVLVLPRNLFFLLVVVFHGIRRLFPPF